MAFTPTRLKNKRFVFTAEQMTKQFRFIIQRAKLNADFTEHTHAFHEIVIITGGTATHRVDGSDQFIKAGDVYVFTGDRSHGFISPRALSLWNVEYDPALLAPVASSLRTLPGYQALFLIGPRSRSVMPVVHLTAAGRLWTERQLARMEQEYVTRASGYEAVVTGLFFELTAYLSRAYTARGGDASGVHAAARAASFIEEHFRSAFSTEDLTDAAGVSTRHVRRLFLRHYGMNPTDYCMRLRVHAAAADLAETDRTITDIAYDSGFSDSNYFARCFRRFMKTSPRNYRASSRRNAHTGTE
ncbi:MAG: helix-turn-helix domain-containing protein [Spirochaetes bacterium]|nr:helix-turn-helix domain-containing protein [Spirochaetota bacterium]